MPNDLKISGGKAKSILVCFAVGTEASAFRSIHKTDDKFQYHRLITGMGSNNAEEVVRRKLDQLSAVDEIWSCGFAGGLNPELELGAGIYSWNMESVTDRSNMIASRLKSVGFRQGTFKMTRVPLDTAEQKQELFRESGADAVEMESGVIAQIGAERSIPTLTLRAISDTADESFPIPFGRLMDDNQRIRVFRLMGFVVSHPGLLVRLIRFRNNLEKPLKNLKEALAKISEPTN